jgi:hypothetical protein
MAELNDHRNERFCGAIEKLHNALVWSSKAKEDVIVLTKDVAKLFL